MIRTAVYDDADGMGCVRKGAPGGGRGRPKKVRIPPRGESDGMECGAGKTRRQCPPPGPWLPGGPKWSYPSKSKAASPLPPGVAFWGLSVWLSLQLSLLWLSGGWGFWLGVGGLPVGLGVYMVVFDFGCLCFFARILFYMISGGEGTLCRYLQHAFLSQHVDKLVHVLRLHATRASRRFAHLPHVEFALVTLHAILHVEGFR